MYYLLYIDITLPPTHHIYIYIYLTYIYPLAVVWCGVVPSQPVTRIEHPPTNHGLITVDLSALTGNDNDIWNNLTFCISG